MLSKAITHYSIIMIVRYERQQGFSHILSEWGRCKGSFLEVFKISWAFCCWLGHTFSTKAISSHTQTKRKLGESGNAEDLTCALQCQVYFFIAISFSSLHCSELWHHSPQRHTWHHVVIVAYHSQSLWQALKLLYASAKTKRVFLILGFITSLTLVRFT